jgi:hypothetical protein
LSVECLEDRFLLAAGLLPAPLFALPSGTAARVSPTTPYEGRTEAEFAALRLAQLSALAATGTEKASPEFAHGRPDQDDRARAAEYRDRLGHDGASSLAILGEALSLKGAEGGRPGAAAASVPPAPAGPVLPGAPAGRKPPAQEMTGQVVEAVVAQAPLPAAVSTAPAAGGALAQACREPDGAAPGTEPEALGAAPPGGTPLAGALPFDLGALERGVDRFFAQLGDLREEWDGAWAPARLLPWLTAATATALVIARRRDAAAAALRRPAVALLLPRGQP